MHDLVPCPASTLHPILHPRGLGSCGTTPSPQNPHRSPLHAHLAGPAPCAALQRPSGPDLGHPVQRRLPLAAQLVHGRHSTGLGHPRYATRLPRVVSILGRVCWCWRLLTLRGRWEGGGGGARRDACHWRAGALRPRALCRNACWRCVAPAFRFGLPAPVHLEAQRCIGFPRISTPPGRWR